VYLVAVCLRQNFAIHSHRHLSSQDAEMHLCVVNVVYWTTWETKTSSSAIAKRPRYASCLSVDSFNSTIPPAQFSYH